MNEKLETAVKILLDKISATSTPDEALRYTQAALNLAHAKQVLSAAGKLQ